MAQTVTLCKICNKPVKAGASVAGACGTRCAQLAQLGVNAGVIASAKQAYAVASIPAGFIGIAQVHNLLANNPQWGCTVAKMVQCTGSDRPYLLPALGAGNTGKLQYAHALCVPLIATGSKTRMLPAWLGTQAGAQAMATGNFTGAPKPHALQVALYNKATKK
jgi:hypothetical protein